MPISFSSLREAASRSLRRASSTAWRRRSVSDCPSGLDSDVLDEGSDTTNAEVLWRGLLAVLAVAIAALARRASLIRLARSSGRYE